MWYNTNIHSNDTFSGRNRGQDKACGWIFAHCQDSWNNTYVRRTDVNYLKQINGFWIWRKLNTLTHSQMDLYFALLDCANTAAWREDFTVPNSTLMNLCQLSKAQMCKDRNRLTQLELIKYTPGKRGQAGSYAIVPLYKTNPETNPETNHETNDETIYKNKNININKNLKYFQQFSIYSDNYDHEKLEKLTRKRYDDDFEPFQDNPTLQDE